MTALPAAAGQPGRDDLTTRIFCALYQDFTVHTIKGTYVVVPKGVPCFASSSLGEIARQISTYQHPHKDQPPGSPPRGLPGSPGPGLRQPPIWLRPGVVSGCIVMRPQKSQVPAEAVWLTLGCVVGASATMV